MADKANFLPVVADLLLINLYGERIHDLTVVSNKNSELSCPFSRFEFAYTREGENTNRGGLR